MPRNRTIPQPCESCGTPIPRLNNRFCSRRCSSPHHHPPLSDRLWAKVAKPNGEDGCWPWTGTILNTGYGRIMSEGRPRSTHRVAWELANGPIPEGLWVLHRCDNPPCCNPAHLFLGTCTDNNRDAAAKGRTALGDRNGQRIHPDRTARGVKQGHAKFASEDVVTEIRKRLAAKTETQLVIARAFGVSPSVISRLARGETYKDS